MTADLLRQVRLLDPASNTDRLTDVLIVDGRIEAIQDQITAGPDEATVWEQPGLVAGPGLVDLYSHSGEPGFESRETLASLLQAATAGGFSRITLLPDTTPAIDSPALVDWVQTQATVALPGEARPRVSCWGALTQGVQGKQMTELMELARANVVGFADGHPLQNWTLVQRLLEYVRPLGKPLALWPCDRRLTGDGIVRDGVEAIYLGLPGSPAIAETAPLAALLECVEAIGTPIHIMRVSTARSVELIRTAKARDLPVTASTTWMHLLLNSGAVASYDPGLRLDPPLGNSADQQALQQAVRDGVLEAIAIDHTPYTYEEKTVAFAEAPPGAIGLELALPLLWQQLVVVQDWPPLTLWRSLSTNPARCLGQSAASLQPGQPAELTLFDPNPTWTVSSVTLKSLAINTPWLGQQIRGQVVHTWQG